MRSFVRRGHSFHLHVYEFFDVPDGVSLIDAAKTLPKEALFFFDNPTTGKPDLGPFSDLFRFKLLLEGGGWYVDVDTICMADNLPAGIRAWAQENPRLYPRVVNGAQICLPSKDPLAKVLYERCLRLSKNFDTREDLGPNLLGDVILGAGLPPNMFGTPATFYPIDWIAIFKLVLPKYCEEVRQKASAAHFLAAYQSFFQYCGIDLARTPPVGSYLQELYEIMVPDRMKQKTYSVEEVIELVRAYFEHNRNWAIADLVEVAGPEILNDLGIENSGAGSS